MGFDITKTLSNATGTLDRYVFVKKWWPYILILLGILFVIVIIKGTPQQSLFPTP